jgi:hypothetical protein
MPGRRQDEDKNTILDRLCGNILIDGSLNVYSMPCYAHLSAHLHNHTGKASRTHGAERMKPSLSARLLVDS